jgi:TonB-dependent SusC/RagA subfamily outer membrane receptor
MKRIFAIIFASLLVLGASAQDRKAERMERRAQRRAERAVYDSIRVRQMEDDSIYVGYGYIKRKNLTTSVSKVDVMDIQMKGYTSIGEYLKGRVPGLQVMKTGSGYRYLIRGVSSINSPTDPLFIVDGMEVNDIDSINPNDVERVEVLKDASASIYGNRGACGVIIITTKRP